MKRNIVLILLYNMNEKNMIVSKPIYDFSREMVSLNQINKS